MTGFDENARKKSDQTKLTVRMGSSVSDRVDAHLHLLKQMRKQISKSNWISEAIAEKFKGDEINFVQRFSEKRLQVSVDTDLIESMNSIMEDLRQMGVAQTKQRLILEAIVEKLDRESREVWDWLGDLQKQKSSSEKK